MISEELKKRFDTETRDHKVALYMKGNALFPRCGFSARTLEALKPFRPGFTVDVLTEPDVRDGIKAYSNWPTIPQVFINGKFVGGCDIVRELHSSGELRTLVKTALGESAHQ